jgi:hypothetical protein
VVAEIGVHAEREVDWRRSGRQHAHIAARRVDEDLVAEDVGLYGLKEVFGARRFLLPLDQVAEGYRAMDERRAIKVLLRP